MVDKAKTHEVAIILVSLVVVVLGIYGLQQLDVVTVGEAIYGAAPKSELAKPLEADGTCKTGVVAKNVDWDGVAKEVVNKGACCSSANFCVGGSKPKKDGGYESGSYCYSAGSIIYEGKDWHCASSYTGKDGTKKSYVWVTCNTNTKGQLTDDKKFVCKYSSGDKGDWTQCTKSELQEGYYCAGPGKVWEQCTKQDQLSSDKTRICTADPNDKTKLVWKTCGIGGGGKEGSLFCHQGTWKACSSSKDKGVFGSGYCDGKEWAQCSVNSIDLVKDKKYYCDASNDQWKTCDDKTKGIAGIKSKAFYCDGKEWLTCSADTIYATQDDEKWLCNGNTWESCPSTKPPADFICKDNKWSLDVKSGTSYKALLQQFTAEKGASNADTVDVSTQAFFNVLTPGKKAFFSYKDGDKESFYLVELNDKSELVVREISGTTALSTTKLDLQKGSTHVIKPVQVTLDLGGKKAAAYLHAIVGTTKFDQSVLIAISPRLSFDVDNKNKVKAVLAPGIKQAFTFKGEQALSLFWEKSNDGTDNNYFLFFNNEDKHKAQKGAKGAYYFNDKTKTQQLAFEVLETFSGFAIVEFTPTADFLAVAGAKVIPYDLSEFYEVSFGKTNIVDIGIQKDATKKDGTTIFTKNGIVNVCPKDVATDAALTVCSDETNLFNLKKGEPYLLGKVLFLYEGTKDGVQTGKVYHVIDLMQDVDEKAEFFAGNLVAKKGVVLKLGSDNYLLTHTAEKLLDLEKLKLTRLGSGEEYLPAGNQDEVIFHLPLGKKITINLDVDKIPLSYTLSAKVVSQDNLNLVTSFQTQVSTYGKVGVTIPTLAAVQIDVAGEKEITLLKKKMKIACGSCTNGNKHELTIDVPTILRAADGKVMALYNQFSAGTANTFAKYADLHLYENLTKNTLELDFKDNDFILPLVKGNKIAFELDNQFYLLTYAKKWTGKEADGFDAEEMQLTTLDGKNAIKAQEEGDGFTFKLANNRIDFTIDTKNTKIKFEGITRQDVKKEQVKAATEVTDFKSDKEFVANLVPGTDDKPVSVKVDGTEFKICDKDDLKFIQGTVTVCGDKEYTLKLNEEVDVGNTKMKYLGVVSGKKTVQFRFLLDITQEQEWTKLTDILAAKKNPLVSVNKKLYALLGGKKLSDFALLDNAGKTHSIVMQSTKEAAETGTIAVNGSLLYFEQKLDGSLIKLNIKELQTKMVDSTVREIKSSELFITKVGGDEYKTQQNIVGNLVSVALFKGNELVYGGHLPKGVTSTVLLPDGAVVKIKVEELKDGKAQVTITT